MHILNTTFEDIRLMKIRGAGRIARAAVKALGDYGTSLDVGVSSEFVAKIREAGEYLKGARPTAVSLPNAINYVVLNFEKEAKDMEDVASLKRVLKKYCELFVERSESAVEKIGLIGARLIQDGDTILTHCNSEAAISVILTAHNQQKNIKVFCTETRPKGQGYLTSSKLAKNGVDVTLIVDSAVNFFIKKVDQVVVGADAIYVNGAVVNKVGTSQVALVANQAKCRFMVAAESYKIAPNTFVGESIPIEERSPDEIAPKEWAQENKEVKIRNPSFDITPPKYIDSIITEVGIFPPEGIILLYKETYGLG
ncbi:MAG: ribose 1,5-bisphosphate isomerase [Nitrososphaeria archaeon]